MARNDLKILVPPVLLTSFLLLFWGLNAGSLVVALVLAAILDGRRYVKVEWDFGESGQVKAFQLSLLLIAMVVALSWIDDEGRSGALNVVRWLPVLLLPVEFVQRYGSSDRVNLNNFFYFSRKRMEQDRKEGREVHPRQVNTGYPYLFGVLTAGCTGEELPWFFWPSLCAAFFLLVASVYRSRGLQLRGLLWALPIVIGLGWVTQWGMTTVYLWAKEKMRMGRGLMENNTYFADLNAHLGDLGDVKLNPKIEWRVWGEGSPNYLKLASYNLYRDGRWTYAYNREGFSAPQGSYAARPRRALQHEGELYSYYRDEDVSRLKRVDEDDAYEVRGTVTHKQSSTVVPSVPGYFGASDVLGDVAELQVNTMGSMQVVEREMVLNYTLYANDEGKVMDVKPVEGVDYEVDKDEQAVISTLVDELGLREMDSPEDVVVAIERYFAKAFEYSTDFDPGERDYERTKLEWFLETVKKGHCEYYASATVLLLREVGIPARYTVGYAVMERDGDRWNVRGTHAHAWVRAYIDGKWINVDTTPPDFRGVAAHSEINPVDWLREQIAILREDFFIWRIDPENRSLFLTRAGIAGGILVLWIVYRLWSARSRRESDGQIGYLWDGDVVVTPLHKLEKLVRKKVGPRGAGEDYGAWVGRLKEFGEVDAALVDSVVMEHRRLRFDPRAVAEMAELQSMVGELKSQLRKVSGPRHQSPEG
ncbi:transglutaminase-like domain-containing protein [Rubritalea tangerina]|uniref:Transglutaminase family protein n=1 Tax=Rubritalea tangerina TaxID=430798 RepID=A0ABW4Z8U0_9BACT